MLEWWQAVVLGLVEGVTEYLPISSTGHLILASSLMGLDTPERKASVDAFTIVIQGGAIIAVLGLYWPSVVRMLRGLIGRDPAGLRLLINLAIAFLPAAVFGLLLDDYIDRHLFAIGPVLFALGAGALYMMIVDLWRQGRLSPPRPWRATEMTVFDVSPRQALFIGLLQCIAMWPGTSRSMMTITGGMLVGLKPKQAAEFSFLLGLPTLGAATLYKLAKNLKTSHELGTENLFAQLGVVPCIIGLVVAAFSAALAVRWLVTFLNRHGLTLFAWYRLALCVVLISLYTAGIVTVQPEQEPPRQPQQVPPINWDKVGRGEPAGPADPQSCNTLASTVDQSWVLSPTS